MTNKTKQEAERLKSLEIKNRHEEEDRRRDRIDGIILFTFAAGVVISGFLVIIVEMV